MIATDILMAEHRLIESVLDTLEEGAQALDSGADVPAEFFLGAAEFIRGYADDYHHRKEEGILFKAMARHGFPEDQGPVGMMLMEHDEARAFTRELHDGAVRLKAGDAQAKAGIVRNALAYVGLLRHHIEKEDNILYMMAEHAIPPNEQDEMAADFERVERDEFDATAQERFKALAADLRQRMRA